MKRTMDSKRSGETGSVAVEFAILVAVLLLLVFGILEFGLALYDKQVITNASRVAARAGIVIGDPRPTTADIQSAVTNYLTNAGFSASDATVTVVGAGGASLTDLEVTVQYPYDFTVLSHFVPGMAGTVVLEATTTMMNE